MILKISILLWFLFQMEPEPGTFLRLHSLLYEMIGN